MIVDICNWMNGSVSYESAKTMPIDEVIRIKNVAHKLNKKSKKAAENN